MQQCSFRWAIYAIEDQVVRRKQSGRDWSRIARIHPQRSGVDDEIDIRELHTHYRFLPRDSFKACRGAKHASFHKKRTQSLRKSIRFSQCAICQNEAFAVLKRALPGNSAPRSATRADYQHPKNDQIDRELTANGTQKSFAVSIRSDEFLIANANRIHRSGASRRFIRLVDLREPRDFVWYGQVQSEEIQASQKAQCRSQFIRPDMETRVLSIDLAGAQRSVVHLWRERMRNRITKNPEANGRVNFARGLIPLFKVSECVPLGCLHVVRVGNIENTTLELEGEWVVSGEPRRPACNASPGSDRARPRDRELFRRVRLSL